jgi:hypothetical protein
MGLEVDQHPIHDHIRIGAAQLRRGEGGPEDRLLGGPDKVGTFLEEAHVALNGIIDSNVITPSAAKFIPVERNSSIRRCSARMPPDWAAISATLIRLVPEAVVDRDVISSHLPRICPSPC